MSPLQFRFFKISQIWRLINILVWMTWGRVHSRRCCWSLTLSSLRSGSCWYFFWSSRRLFNRATLMNCIGFNSHIIGTFAMNASIIWAWSWLSDILKRSYSSSESGFAFDFPALFSYFFFGLDWFLGDINSGVLAFGKGFFTSLLRYAFRLRMIM